MNTDLFNAVKQIVAKEGESILSDPKRMEAFLADLAKDVPKADKNALIKCLEQDFAKALKNTPETERASVKEKMSQRLHDDEMLDLAFCTEILGLLEMVLFGKVSAPIQQSTTQPIQQPQPKQQDTPKTKTVVTIPTRFTTTALNNEVTRLKSRISSLEIQIRTEENELSLDYKILRQEQRDVRAASMGNDMQSFISGVGAGAASNLIEKQIKKAESELAELKKELASCEEQLKVCEALLQKPEEQRVEEYYQGLVQAKSSATTAEEYQKLARQFRELIPNEKAAELAKECDNLCRSFIERGKPILVETRKKIAKYQGLISINKGWNEYVGFTIAVNTFGKVITPTGTDRYFAAYSKCIYNEYHVSAWDDIIAIANGCVHIVGLELGGTVIASGFHLDRECNVSDWSDIIAIAAGSFHTVGLKNDGTVVAVGDNDHGQCNVNNWRDIVAVAAGGNHTVGLKADGTVVATQHNVSKWRNIVAIATSNSCTVGLKADGRVNSTSDVVGWSDIVAIAADNRIVGLKADGTVVTNRKDIDTSAWKNIVAIATASDIIVGLKADGTVDLAMIEDSRQKFYHHNSDKFTNIGPFDMVAYEQRRIEQSKEWASQGLCRYCGGKVGGLFKKKCKACGKEQ